MKNLFLQIIKTVVKYLLLNIFHTRLTAIDVQNNKNISRPRPKLASKQIRP